MADIAAILQKKKLYKADIVKLLEADAPDQLKQIFQKAYAVKAKHVGQVVYFRGLIEFSNRCRKDCLYCGIRKSNAAVDRYTLSDEEILQAARYAYQNRYASVVLQSGENSSPDFIKRVGLLVEQIKELSDNKLGITLSCGEQSPQTYQQWFEQGAHRYLLRIETSNRDLYYKIHPKNDVHNYDRRLEALNALKNTGYQVGTGVMIGLPFQTTTDLADDLLFMQAIDVDMVGMGPYLEHEQTPLYQYRDQLRPKQERFYLALRMIATLRILMPDINIAAATALQAIDPNGREKALKTGANVMMPNLTPTQQRDNYKLYENKPCLDEDAIDCKNCLEARIHLAGDSIGYDQWGDSLHFQKRQEK